MGDIRILVPFHLREFTRTTSLRKAKWKGPINIPVTLRVAKTAIRDWTNRNNKKHWESLTGLKQAKGLILEPSARRTKDLLKLSRDQLRWVVGLFTGRCHLKGHLFKLGLTDDPTCERCLETDEIATHISYVIVRP
jgi:hypothetical protein